MDECRQRSGPTQVELRVGGADLDRAESGVDASVPPDVGVVLQPTGGADLVRHPTEVLEVVELGSHRGPGITSEDHGAGTGQAGVLAEPKWRVGGQRIEQRDMNADAV